MSYQVIPLLAHECSGKACPATKPPKVAIPAEAEIQKM